MKTLGGFTLFTRPRESLPAYLLATSRRYGPIVRFRNPWRSLYFVDDPAMLDAVLVTKAASFVKGRGTQRLRRLLGDGLLTAEAPAHLAHRRLVAPAFHKDRIDACAATIVAATRRRIATWAPGAVIAVDREMTALALEIVASALFGSDLSADTAAIGDALDAALATFPFAMLPFSEAFDRVPIAPTRRFRAARAVLDAIVERLVAERLASGRDAGDLLSMLLAHRDDAATGDAWVRDEVMTIVLAGHETTANALAWTFYLLQRHPDVEARLAAHLADVLGARDPTLADVPQLTYVRALFAETLRLYPPAWIATRRALEPIEIGGARIARGDMVLFSQYVTHRNARSWPQPERFRPERFLGAPPEKFAYFPFGGGNRVCIGERFAWLEGILAIATIARRVRLAAVDLAPVATEPFVTLRPKTAIRARVSPRASAATLAAT